MKNGLVKASNKRVFFRILPMLVLAAVLLSLSAGAACAASYGRIDAVQGVPNLIGQDNSYRVDLTTPLQSSLVLTATAGQTAADSTGTRLRWSITAEPGTTGTGSITTPQGGVTSLEATNQSVCTLTFANTSVTDKFTVTAQIIDAAGISVGTSAIVKVGFKAQVNLTGVTLNKTALTVRSGGKPVYLKAAASPTNATGVAYTWLSKSPAAVTITQMTPLSPDTALVTGAYPGYSSTVQVQAVSYGSSPFTAACEVTVADKGEVADDMMVPATKGSPEEISYMTLYAVDAPFVKDGYSLDEAKIKAASGAAGSVRYILTSYDISPLPMINNDRAGIMTALGETNYAATTAGAMRVDLNFMPPMAKGDMVPFVLAFRLDGLVMPDGRTTLTAPVSQQTFMNNFRLVKYFERDNKRYNIDLSRVMHAKSPSGYTKTANGKTQLTPLIVLVDAPAPQAGCDARAGAQNEFGVKYDKQSETLFIYDGIADTKISDPLVLEYNAPRSGGGRHYADDASVA